MAIGAVALVTVVILVTPAGACGERPLPPLADVLADPVLSAELRGVAVTEVIATRPNLYVWGPASTTAVIRVWGEPPDPLRWSADTGLLGRSTDPCRSGDERLGTQHRRAVGFELDGDIPSTGDEGTIVEFTMVEAALAEQIFGTPVVREISDNARVLAAARLWLRPLRDAAIALAVMAAIVHLRGWWSRRRDDRWLRPDHL